MITERLREQANELPKAARAWDKTAIQHLISDFDFQVFFVFNFFDLIGSKMACSFCNTCTVKASQDLQQRSAAEQHDPAGTLAVFFAWSASVAGSALLQCLLGEWWCIRCQWQQPVHAQQSQHVQQQHSNWQQSKYCAQLSSISAAAWALSLTCCCCLNWAGSLLLWPQMYGQYRCIFLSCLGI